MESAENTYYSMIRTPEDHQVMLFSELDHIIGNPRYLIGKSIYISGLTSENAKNMD